MGKNESESPRTEPSELNTHERIFPPLIEERDRRTDREHHPETRINYSQPESIQAFAAPGTKNNVVEPKLKGRRKPVRPSVPKSEFLGDGGIPGQPAKCQWGSCSQDADVHAPKWVVGSQVLGTDINLATDAPNGQINNLGASSKVHLDVHCHGQLALDLSRESEIWVED